MISGTTPGTPRRLDVGWPPRGVFKTEEVGMTRSEIETKARNVVCQSLGVDADQVLAESSFTRDLGADGLDCIELVMALEEEFDVSVPVEDGDGLDTFGKAVDWLVGRLT
jgi:acyl carrier protein